MSGGIGRKRARSEDGDDVANENEPITGASAMATGTGTIKRQRLARSSSVVNRDGTDDDAALFPGADISTTPKTPRTVHAVASAITGAFAYGVGSLVSAGKARGKSGDRLLPRPFTSLLNSRDARSSQDDLDKLYDVPSDDNEADGGMTRPVPESDVEGDTLVGSASPTPDTPSKKKPPSTTMKTTASTETTTTTPSDKKKKRRDPLEDLAIDGTDKLKSGLETSLSRHDRGRSTPKRYMEGGGGNNSSRSRNKAANRKSTANGTSAVASPAVEASPAVVGATDSANASTTRKRARAALPKEAPPKETPSPSTPTKGPSSARRKTTPKADTADANRGTPTSTRRGQAKTLLSTVEPEPKRPRGKSVAKDTAKDTAPEQPPQENEAVETEKEEEVGKVRDKDADDSEVCAICSKPDSEPLNEIVFCETCDLAVHQQCYNVPVIPEGDWFCKNCVRQQQQQQQADQDNSGDKEYDTQEADPATATEKEELAAATELVAATAARDLAPDIANFEHHLAKMKRVLLGRCTGRHRVRLQGQDDAYDKVYQVVKQTVVAGEGNSMMVIGARGTGKTTMIETILEDLADEHGGAFHVVRLNGFIHTDDKLALREIWRQLGKEMAVEDDVVNKTNNYADTLASLLALLSHPSEIQAATIGTGAVDKEGDAAALVAVTSTAVVFVMDEFDLFATHARQTLLYNLFDIAQARKAPIAVLGLTTKIDVVESLEKRVKSRFSHRYVYLPLACSLPAFWDICRHGLVVDDKEDKEQGILDAMDIDEKEGHAEFRQWWKHMIDTAKDDAHFQEQLAFHFYSSKSVPAFWTTCIMPLAAVSSAAPRLQLPPVGDTVLGGVLGATEVVRGPGRPARTGGGGSKGDTASSKTLDDVDPLSLAPPDSKLHLLAALSELELSLLIAAARLDIVLNTDTVNFAMAYDEYVSLMSKQRVQSSLAASGVGAIRSGRGVGRPPGSGATVVGGGARVWGRGVASRAWERLAALGLLIPAGMGASARSRGAGGGTNALVTSGLEGRSMWRTEVALEEIAAAPGVRLGAVLGRWCREI